MYQKQSQRVKWTCSPIPPSNKMERFSFINEFAGNLRLQVRKCEFCKDMVEFLGHVISPAGISTDPEKISKVLNWPTPVNKQEIQQFMGLFNYYRRFIKNCSEVSKPLSQLTERNCLFKWTVQCQESFEALRRALASAPVLAFPDFLQTFILDTNASNHGIGGVLSQTRVFSRSRWWPMLVGL